MQACRTLLLATVTALAFTTQAFAVEKMKIGIQGANPPFNSKDTSGQVAGFDLEIGKALCARMKVECEVVTSDWDGLIPALNEGQTDFVISSMSITEERKQLVDFTAPYYVNKLQFVAPKSTDFPTDKATLKQTLVDKTIGAPIATQASDWLQTNLGAAITIKLYGTPDKAYTDLAGGGIYALLADKYASYEWLKSEAGQNFEFKGEPVVERDQVGIAVRKGDPLRDRLNIALKSIIEDGSYKKINDKYFPFSIL
jgi:polar amino acid transport system substrate-binding protein